MNNQYQELISTLSGQHRTLLTSLLATQDASEWESHKHLVVCPMPLLTLEMAVNRIAERENCRNSVPSPEMIKTALNYAFAKRKQYLNIKQTEAAATP